MLPPTGLPSGSEGNPRTPGMEVSKREQKIHIAQENKISRGKTIQSMANKCQSAHDFHNNNYNKDLGTQEDSKVSALEGNSI